MTKVLIATVKPFAPAAVSEIKSTLDAAAYDYTFFEKYSTQDELIEAVKDADALIIRSDKITREVLEAAANLKIVVRAGAGYDNVDLAAATEKGVVVMNTPGQNSNAVAELALGMMVYQARNHFNGTSGTELKGKTLGIHAYGHVGRLVARIAHGFGMEVIAFDPFIPKETIQKDGVAVAESVEDMYATCNYISLHIPANEHTKRSINYNLLSKMQKGATLVNTARKEVIDEEGLLKIFEENESFNYVSDIAPDNKELLEEKFGNRCFFTPKKMGAQTAEANINAGIAAAKQIIGYIQKGDTTFKVN
ncbi:MAG: 3-phosphoglycerate dehydrogenase [Bacteroidetes bacterium]|nr:MAG: 3-phosphoglycerate dehydrogenase [Bacteroidota bacterium]RLD71544.1 MAG: 3-phosphoglycerate dehydrogenase [Bacteroidota bacterium]RLD84540.1 MAG: 3-phosphoglycerate dehydrogenase [Bacteroidota bacterium]